MRYRWRSLLAVVLVLVGVNASCMAAAVADTTPPVPTCPAGSAPAYGGRCINYDGTQAGGGTVTPTPPVPPLYPSSVGASLAQPSGSDQQTNVAILNMGGKNLQYQKGIGNVQAAGLIVDAAQTGFSLGTAGASIGCSFGVNALCNPTSVPGYVPNGDVGQDPAGWVGAYPSGTWLGSNNNSNGVNWTAHGIGLNVDNTYWTYGGAVPSSISQTFALHGTVDSVTKVGAANDYPTFAATLILACKDGTSGGGISIGTTPRWTVAGPYTATGGALTVSTGVTTSTCSTHGGVGYLGLDNLSWWGGQSWTPSQTQLEATYCTNSIPCVEDWYPIGHPKRPTFNSNPDRWWRTGVTCTGSNTELLGAASAHFKETDATLPGYPSAPPCPAGSSAVSAHVYEYGDNVGTRTVWTWTAPQGYQNFATTYPGCTPDAGSPCTLGLWRVDGVAPANCYTSNDLCSGWFTDANKATNYKCTYGVGAAVKYDASQVIDLSECTVLAPTFDPKMQQEGKPYGNPVTGAPPGDTDTGGPGSGSSGGSGGSDGQGGDKAPACYPTGWSALNPVEWIVKPLWCLAKVLFKVNPADFLGWNSLQLNFQSSAPGSLVNHGGEWVRTLLNTYTSCSDASTCGLPADEYGFISGAASAGQNSSWQLIRTLIGWGCWLGAFLAIWRLVASGLGTHE